MYPWSFLCEEAKIKQPTFSKYNMEIPIHMLFCFLAEEAVFVKK